MDVWEYFQTREKEIRDASLYVREGTHLFAAEEGDETRGKMLGPVFFSGFPESVFLRVYEIIRVTGSGIHRPRYAYFLVIDGNEIGGYERHATHRPPVHRHCSGQKHHQRSPSRAISFKEAAREAWQYVSQFAQPLAP